MTCPEFENLLHPYVDDEFDAAEKSAAESHLASCDACSRRVMAERRTRVLVRTALAEHPEQAHAPDALRARLHRGLRAEQRRVALRRAATVAACAACVAAIAAAGWQAMPKRRDGFALDAARRHARPFPAEIRAEPPEKVEAWLQQNLEHRVALPRFADAHPAEARLWHLQDRPAAYIRYVKSHPDGERRTLGVWVYDDSDNEVEAPAFPSIEVEQRLGYNVVFWRDREIVYQMVTDLDDAAIRAMLERRPPPVEVRPAALER